MGVTCPREHRGLFLHTRLYRPGGPIPTGRDGVPLHPAWRGTTTIMATHEVPTQPRRGWLARQFLRAPVLLYRLGLGSRLQKKFLVLTTTGRRTGRPRTVALDYLQEGGRVFVFAGSGPRSHWYRNLLAQPRATVQVGARRFQGVARPVEDVAERRRLLEMLRQKALSGGHGPPRPVRWLMKRLRILDYEAEMSRAVERLKHVPAVEITPLAEDKEKG